MDESDTLEQVGRKSFIFSIVPPFCIILNKKLGIQQLEIKNMKFIHILFERFSTLSKELRLPRLPTQLPKLKALPKAFRNFTMNQILVAFYASSLTLYYYNVVYDS